MGNYLLAVLDVNCQDDMLGFENWSLRLVITNDNVVTIEPHIISGKSLLRQAMTNVTVGPKFGAVRRTPKRVCFAVPKRLCCPYVCS